MISCWLQVIFKSIHIHWHTSEIFLPIRLKVLVALNLGTYEHYTPFSLTVLLLFIQVIRGLYQSELWEESRIVWRGVTWVAIVPVVWLYCFFPFPCLPPNHFPKTKEYKTANAFTTHWRRQGELCRLHYLFTVETGISLNETAVSIPPWSHCGGLQSQLLLYHYLSLLHQQHLLPPHATGRHYRSLPELPAEEGSFSWAGWEQKIQHWHQQQQQISGDVLLHSASA